MAVKNVFHVNAEGFNAYDILLERSFASLPDEMKKLNVADRRICVVTDSNVSKLYSQEVQELLRPICREVSEYVIPAGEENKNLDEIKKIYVHLIEHEFDRGDMLVALGGGVTGDMTGYAAATYLRGISFVQVPTTLLAQVDSSNGGKTGVDFDSYKNMVGAFHQPSMVYINISTLKTLADDQFACGMGEVLKHGLIRDAAYYEWCIENMSEIADRDEQVLKEMVFRSVAIKGGVVQRDPKEKGERALLNFGHTLGHAIEKMKNFELGHGQCVALGCVAAAYISMKRGYLDSDEFYEIRDMMVGFDLPISFDSLSSEEIIACTRHDKKMKAGQIRFILLKSIGHAFIDTSVTDAEMLEALNTLNADVFERSGE